MTFSMLACPEGHLFLITSATLKTFVHSLTDLGQIALDVESISKLKINANQAKIHRNLPICVNGVSLDLSILVALFLPTVG